MSLTLYPASSGGSGDVVGPASSTDNAVARYDSTTGKLLQNSTVICDDSGNLTGVGTVNAVKVYRALLTQSGDGTSTATSGTLTVGVRYKISTYIAGDDFTNVGAASNATDVQFTATGTTPTAWTEGSTLTDTSAPVATVLENTLGGTVVWTRGAPGDYQGTLAGLFIEGKTALLSGTSLNVNGDYASIYFRRENDNVVTISTSDTGIAADNILAATFVQILVYP